MYIKKTMRFFLSLLLCVMALNTYAVTLEITDNLDNPISIANVPFSNNASQFSDIAAIVDADLKRSGVFKPMYRSQMQARPTTSEQINFADWERRAVEYMLIGRVKKSGGANRVEYELFDVRTKERKAGGVLTASPKQMRKIAHRISDVIYKALTGREGAFSTSIAYVSKQQLGSKRSRYFLIKADADGESPNILLESYQPILSPSWSPDGNRIAYVSFENGKPEIYIQNVKTRARSRVTRFAGLNGAPAWSPDGRKLAMVLSKDGNPEIYVMDIASRQLRRVTRNTYAIDTEPSWYPDSRHLVITSDRGGRPQLYKLDTATGRAQRLTRLGGYNARGRVLPNGEGLVMVHGNRGYRIAYLEFRTGQLKILSNTRADESPSIAPNSSMVMYATQRGSKGQLAVVSLDGRARYFLPTRSLDIREPAWSNK